MIGQRRKGLGCSHTKEKVNVTSFSKEAKITPKSHTGKNQWKSSFSRVTAYQTTCVFASPS